ncbi:MAG: hypothetical protein IKM51_04120, partial [Oscillospiraceae bacterium]|nr:hypothetical protein [Oscillospiraceae bacterium]
MPPEETLPAQTPDEFTHLKVHMYGHYPYVSLDLLGNTAFADGVFDSLLYMDPDEPDNIKGCLAQSWTHSDDWLSWTFNIKEGITFSDGTACDAYAIAESFDILFGDCKNNSAKNPPNSINLINWEALGQYEFVLYLSSPCAWIETQLSIGEYLVISPTAFELYGENDIRAYVGTGPYVLEEYVEFDYDLEAAWVTLKANYNYHTPERAPIADKLT